MKHLSALRSIATMNSGSMHADDSLTSRDRKGAIFRSNRDIACLRARLAHNACPPYPNLRGSSAD